VKTEKVRRRGKRTNILTLHIARIYNFNEKESLFINKR